MKAGTLVDLRHQCQVLKWTLDNATSLDKAKKTGLELSEATEQYVAAKLEHRFKNYASVDFIEDGISFDSFFYQVQQKSAKLFWHFYLVKKMRYAHVVETTCVWSPKLSKLLGSRGKVYMKLNF